MCWVLRVTNFANKTIKIKSGKKYKTNKIKSGKKSIKQTIRIEDEIAVGELTGSEEDILQNILTALNTRDTLQLVRGG